MCSQERHLTGFALPAQLLTTMESLPDKLLLKIFRSLPVDARARLELVSPRWAQLLRSPELWTAITFDGVSATVTHEALAHIVCCAHGTLRVLDITAPACDHVTAAGLIAALAPQDGSLPAEQLAELITWRPGLPASGPARELSVLQAADIRRACPSLRSAVVELKVAAESCSQAMIALPSGGCAKRLSVRSFRNEPQIRSFCEWLGRQTDTIVHLDVTFTDSNGGAIPFRAVGAEAVALAVLAHPGLVSVVMPNNSLGPGGAQAFVRALAAPRCGLTTLDLASNELGDAGAAHLGPALTDNRSLTWLGLRGNGIGDGGAEVLASLLSMNTALLHLNLDKNSIGDAGATALARGLFRNGNLQTLSLGGNPFGDAGAEGLARALQRAKAGGAGLRTLNVNSTLISPKGACAIADSLERNTVLKSLRLDNVVVGDPGATSLVRLNSLHSFLRPESIQQPSALEPSVLFPNAIADLHPPVRACRASGLLRTRLSLPLTSPPRAWGLKAQRRLPAPSAQAVASRHASTRAWWLRRKILAKPFSLHISLTASRCAKRH